MAASARAKAVRAGSVVLGMSPDPVAKVKKFHDKYDLDFALLADEDHAVAETYGAWGPKTRYGKTSDGLIRSGFVIDRDGTVAAAKVNVNTELRVNQGWASPKTTSFLTMDSTDGRIDTTYHVAWKKC